MSFFKRPKTTTSHPPLQWGDPLLNKCNNKKCTYKNCAQVAEGIYDCQGTHKDRRCPGTYYVSPERAAFVTNYFRDQCNAQDAEALRRKQQREYESEIYQKDMQMQEQEALLEDVVTRREARRAKLSALGDAGLGRRGAYRVPEQRPPPAPTHSERPAYNTLPYPWPTPPTNIPYAAISRQNTQQMRRGYPDARGAEFPSTSSSPLVPTTDSSAHTRARTTSTRQCHYSPVLEAPLPPLPQKVIESTLNLCENFVDVQGNSYNFKLYDKRYMSEC